MGLALVERLASLGVRPISVILAHVGFSLAYVVVVVVGSVVDGARHIRGVSVEFVGASGSTRASESRASPA